MDEGTLKKEARRKVETWGKIWDMQWEEGNSKIGARTPDASKKGPKKLKKIFMWKSIGKCVLKSLRSE